MVSIDLQRQNPQIIPLSGSLLVNQSVKSIQESCKTHLIIVSKVKTCFTRVKCYLKVLELPTLEQHPPNIRPIAKPQFHIVGREAVNSTPAAAMALETRILKGALG